MRVKMDLEVFECDGSDRIGVTVNGTHFDDFFLSRVVWFDHDMATFERGYQGKYLKGISRGIRFDCIEHALIFTSKEDAYEFVEQCNSLFNSAKSEATLIVDLEPAIGEEYLWSKVPPLTEEPTSAPEQSGDSGPLAQAVKALSAFSGHS